jgi:protein PhnA
MQETPACPKCQCTYTYADNNLLVCPECAYEWNSISAEAEANPEAISSVTIIKDANGTVLKDGDTISVIKELRIKGSNSAVKIGTKVKNIKLVDIDDGHNIDCKIPGFGAMSLKSEFVKKVNE